MCRGIALGYNKGKEPHVICEGISSHTKTLGKEEDDYLKFEIIVDESKEFHYSVELDESYFFNGILDETVLKRFSNYFNKDKTVKESVVKAVGAWVKENEVFVLRNLLINSHYGRFKEQNMSYCKAVSNQYMAYCEAGGIQNMAYCEARGFQNMAYCKSKEDQYMCQCEAKGNQNMSGCKAEKDQIMSHCEAGRGQNMAYCKAGHDQNMFGCEAGGIQDMSECKAGEDQYMCQCEAKNNQDISGCKAGEDQIMFGCKAGRNQYIAYMESGDKEANAFLKKLSDLNNKITMAMLIRMAMKCPENVVSIILKGDKKCAEE